jgi:zinc protease
VLRYFAPLFILLTAAVSQAADPQIKFEKYKLANGLTVILSEDHRLPQAAVDIWYHVGASRQAPGKSGFAHLFEHMMFSGAKHIGPQPFKILEGVGSQGGSMVNGTTSWDRTNYFETVPADELPTALWLESDRMAFLLDTLDENKLKVQRDVVSNERRQSYENQPYGTTQLKLCDLLYPAPHPYYNCPIGTIAEIQSASMDDLRSFFRQFYAPNNASLAIVGDFDSAQLKPIIEKYFGPIPRMPEVKAQDVPQPMFTSVVRERIEDKLAELPRLTLAWNGLKPFVADEPAGDVLASILGSGKTSRLYKKLVFEKQVATSTAAYNQTSELGGYFVASALAKAGHTTEELQPMVDQIIDDIKKNGVTAAELERARRKIIAQLLRGVERIGGFGGKADQLNHYQTELGDPGYLSKDIARYRAVTAEEVQAFANKYLLTDRRLILETVPASKTVSAR